MLLCHGWDRGVPPRLSDCPTHIFTSTIAATERLRLRNCRTALGRRPENRLVLLSGTGQVGRRPTSQDVSPRPRTRSPGIEVERNKEGHPSQRRVALRQLMPSALDHDGTTTYPLTEAPTKRVSYAPRQVRGFELAAAGAVQRTCPCSAHAAATRRAPERLRYLPLDAHADGRAVTMMTSAVDDGRDPVVRCHDALPALRRLS